MSQLLITLAIMGYLAVMLHIGYKCSKKTNNVEDFYLGGRTLGPFVTAMSAEASDMSSWLLMGLPGVAYVSGLADAGWTAMGLALGTYINWKFVAKRLRSFSHTLDSITVPSFFAQRFADHNYRISALAAVIIIIFFIPYTASAFAACGKLFSTIFQVDYMTAMILSAIIILVYTVTGGFLAVSFTDLIQSIVMSCALFFVLSYSITSVGGMTVIIDHSFTMDGYFSLLESHNPSTNSSTPYPLLTIVSTFAWGLGYFGMPHILLRFMAIEDEKKLPVAQKVATTWVVCSMVVAIFIGIAGNAMTEYGVLAQLEDPETIIIELAGLLSQHSPTFAIIAGLILAGILAATMSTADSQLLVASSSVSENIIVEFMGKKLTPKRSMLVARLSIVVISVIAVFMAQDPNSSVFGIVSFAWAGFGASFGPVMVLSLFWRRANLQGAMAGMISGGVMVFVWKYYLAPLGGLFAIYELLPAFLVGLGMMTVVSLMTEPPNHEVELLYDASMMPVPPRRPPEPPVTATKGKAAAKPVARPTGKPAAKPVAKPAAKPVAKPVAPAAASPVEATEETPVAPEETAAKNTNPKQSKGTSLADIQEELNMDRSLVEFIEDDDMEEEDFLEDAEEQDVEEMEEVQESVNVEPEEEEEEEENEPPPPPAPTRGQRTSRRSRNRSSSQPVQQEAPPEEAEEREEPVAPTPRKRASNRNRNQAYGQTAPKTENEAEPEVETPVANKNQGYSQPKGQPYGRPAPTPPAPEPEPEETSPVEAEEQVEEVPEVPVTPVRPVVPPVPTGGNRPYGDVTGNKNLAPPVNQRAPRNAPSPGNRPYGDVAGGNNNLAPPASPEQRVSHRAKRNNPPAKNPYGDVTGNNTPETNTPPAGQRVSHRNKNRQTPNPNPENQGDNTGENTEAPQRVSHRNKNRQPPSNEQTSAPVDNQGTGDDAAPAPAQRSSHRSRNRQTGGASNQSAREARRNRRNNENNDNG